MKVKQLDYTSMYNANKIALASRRTNTVNFQTKIGRENAEAMRSIYAKQSSAIGLQTASNLIYSVLDLGKGVASAVDTYRRAKAAEEQADASSSYTHAIGDLEKWCSDQTRAGVSLYKDDGVTPTAEYQAKINETEENLRGLGYSGMTQKSIEDAFTQYKADSWYANLKDSTKALNDATSEKRNQELSDAIEAAIRGGARDYSGVDAKIDEWGDLPSPVRDQIKENAHRAVDSGDVSQQARLITDAKGFNDGLKYLDEKYQSGDITLDEYDQYKSQMYTRHQNNLRMTQQNVVDTFTENVSNGITTARTEAEKVIDGAPEEDREILRSALDQAQLGVFNQNNQWMNELQYMGNDEIQKRLDEIKADEAGYFHGMDGTDGSNDLKSPVMKGLELQMEKNKATEAEAQSKDYKAQKEALRNDIDYVTSEFMAGRTNASSAISSMYGALEKATLLKDTSEGRNIVLTAINKMTDNIIPSWYRDQFKARVNDTIKNLGDLEKYGVDQLDLQAGIEAKVLDFLRDYGNNEWGKSEIDSFLDGFGKEEAGKALEALSTTPEIKWGGGYSTDNADLKSYTKVLNAMASGQMYYTESAGNTIDGAPNMGKVKGITAKAQDQWVQTSAIGEWTINQIFGDGFVNDAQTRPMTYLGFTEKRDDKGNIERDKDGKPVMESRVIATQYYPTFLGQDHKLYTVVPNDETGGLNIMTRSEDGAVWIVSKEIDRNGVYTDENGNKVSILTKNAPVTRSTESAFEAGYYGTTGSKATYDESKEYNEEVSKLVSQNVPIQQARYQAWNEKHPYDGNRKNNGVDNWKPYPDVEVEIDEDSPEFGIVNTEEYKRVQQMEKAIKDNYKKK